MDYRSPLQDSYDSHDRQQSSYGGRYAPYPQRRGHADYRQIQPHPYSADQSSSMAVTKYSNRYKPTSYPKELTAQFGAHNCMLCGLELQSPIVAKMHYSGKQHIKKVKNYLINWSSKTGLPMPEINESLNVNGSALANYCELCDVKMTSINDKILHYSGKNHQKNERDPANAKKKKKAYETVDISGRFGIGESFSAEIPAIEGSKEVDLASQAFYCKLCEVSAVSQDQLNQHISGKKHKEKLEKTYSVDIAKKDKPFKCNICSVSLTTHDLFTLHLQGKRHKKNVSKLETYGTETGEDVKPIMTRQICNFTGYIENNFCDESFIKNEIDNIEQKWVCTFCNGMIFDTEQEYNEHKNTNRHVFSILNNEEEGDVMIEELSHWFCVLCKKQSHTCKDYTDHLFEEKHMVLSQAHPVLESCDLFHCSLCNLTLTKELNDQHQRDPKHIKESIKQGTQKSIANLAHQNLSSMNFNCQNCNVGPLNFIQYSEHVLGDSHMKIMINTKLFYMK